MNTRGTATVDDAFYTFTDTTESRGYRTIPDSGPLV